VFQAGELERAEAILSETIERAKALAEAETESHAWLLRESFRLFWQPEQIDLAESFRAARESLAVVEKAGDDLALARGYVFLWLLYMCTGEGAAQREAAEQALVHAQRGGSRLDESWALVQLGWSLVEGPTPVGEGIRILERLLRELANDPLGHATASVFLANLAAMEGRFDDARAMIARSQAEAEEFAVGYLRTNVDVFGSARVEARLGNLQAAEHAARTGADRCAEIGDNWFHAIASNDLARVVCDQGRPAECLRILEESERISSPPDFEIVVKKTTTRALALGRLGQLEDAEPLAKEAVSYAGRTEFLGYHADALLVLAEVLRLAGRPAEAADALGEAVALYERKGNVVAARKARATLAEVRVQALKGAVDVEGISEEMRGDRES
jgi:tetratricopeptide (TPR) repeat protein